MGDAPSIFGQHLVCCLCMAGGCEGQGTQTDNEAGLDSGRAHQLARVPFEGDLSAPLNGGNAGDGANQGSALQGQRICTGPVLAGGEGIKLGFPHIA